MKITDKEIAEVAGVSRASVSYWRQKKRSPDIDTLYKIEDHYKIPFRILLRENENLDAMKNILKKLKEQEKNLKKIIKKLEEYE
jgi:transcriptional regulator with XRE-family HTH domain